MIGGILFLLSMFFPFGLLAWYIPAMMNSKRGQEDKILFIGLTLTIADMVLMFVGISLMMPHV